MIWNILLALHVGFTGLESQKGHILYLLFATEEGFPNEASRSLRQGSIEAKDAEKGLTFNDLPPGRYALSVFHDENDNDKLDTNFLGLPKEDFGFSQNPAIYFGPPSFERSAFEVKGSSELMIKLRGI